MNSNKIHGAKVLVVDDDPEVARQLSFRSKTCKHAYTGLSSTSQGLERLRIDATSPEIDIVIVDFELGDSSAVTFIEEARTIRPEIPYVIWSHYSSEHIFDHLSRLSLETLLTIDVTAFRDKKGLLAAPQELDDFVDFGLARFRNQLASQVAASVSAQLKNLDVALNQLRSVSNVLDGINPTKERDHFRDQIPIRCLQVRLQRAERSLRQTLGYKHSRSGDTYSKAIDALLEILRPDNSAGVPSAINEALARYITSADEKRRFEVLEIIDQELQSMEPTESTQRAIADNASQLTEFLIYAGQTDRARDLSMKTWRAANGKWSLQPRLVVGFTHSYALAAAGEFHLAEQLASAILSEVEPELTNSGFTEISRSVFASIDDFASGYAELCDGNAAPHH